MAPKRKATDAAPGQTLAKAARKAPREQKPKEAPDAKEKPKALIDSFESILRWNPETLTIIHNETKQQWVLALDQKQTEVSFQAKDGDGPWDVGLTISPAQVLKDEKNREKLVELFCHPEGDLSDEELPLDFVQLRKAALNGGVPEAASELSRQYKESKCCLDDHVVDVTLQWTKRKLVEPLISEHFPTDLCSTILAYDCRLSHSLARHHLLTCLTLVCCAVPCYAVLCRAMPCCFQIGAPTRKEIQEVTKEDLSKKKKKYTFLFDSREFPFPIASVDDDSMSSLDTNFGFHTRRIVRQRSECGKAKQQMAELKIEVGQWRLFQTKETSKPKLGKVISYDETTSTWVLQPYGFHKTTGSMAHCCCYELAAGKNTRRLNAKQIGGIGCHSVGACQKQGRHEDHGAGDGYFGLMALPLTER
jgi:hypothetical protein